MILQLVVSIFKDPLKKKKVTGVAYQNEHKHVVWHSGRQKAAAKASIWLNMFIHFRFGRAWTFPNISVSLVQVRRQVMH